MEIRNSYVFPNASQRLKTFDNDTVYKGNGEIDHIASNAKSGYGLPDNWEKLHKVSDRDGVKLDWIIDGVKIKNSAGYTNLEMYLNEKAGDFRMLNYDTLSSQ